MPFNLHKNNNWFSTIRNAENKKGVSPITKSQLVSDSYLKTNNKKSKIPI